MLTLLIPAVQKLRTEHARTESINHLKQIGLAGHEFHDKNKRLPFNGSNVTVGVVPYSLNAAANNPASGSWGFQIAPYVDQKGMFAAGTSNEPIWAYLCPARGRPGATSTQGVGSVTPPWSDYVINPWLNDSTGGGCAAADAKRTLVGITDGTSNTIFFGHGQIKPADYAATDSVPGYLDTILIGGTTGTALTSNPALGPVTFARDSADTRTDAARGFGGPFAEGCLMCMCDGTVRVFPYSTVVGSFDQPQWGSLAAFLTPAAGDNYHGLPDT